jgi:tRNA-splicing ligase RtcB (3'-phosphate/5'-hydroxy nucleic acid ligase)
MGNATSEQKAFSSACHGAGRALSRHAALKQWSGRKIIDDLAAAGIAVRSPSPRGWLRKRPAPTSDLGPSWRPPNAPDWLAASRA